MRAVIQRVSRAAVRVDGETVGEIGNGYVALIGIASTDGVADIEAFVDKLVGLRVFRDDDDRMNRSIVDVGGSVLLISQFTLLGDVRRGRRPSFTAAAPPDVAEPLYEAAIAAVRKRGITVATGRFGAMMDVELVNDGPVTITIDVTDGRVQ